MEEEWKDVVGFEDYYMVSNFGRVMSKDRYVNDRGTIILRPSKIIAYFHNKYGYCQTSLSKDGKRYRKSIHRLVAEAFIPNIDNLPEVNHKDENKDNNKVDNLEWCTRKYNQVYSFGKPHNHCIDCGKEISKNAKRCVKCNNEIHKREYPDRDTLLAEIKELGFVGTGNKYGVTDSAIRKWCIKLGLPTRKRDI